MALWLIALGEGASLPRLVYVVDRRAVVDQATRFALGEVGVRSYVSEPDRGRRCRRDKKTGETPPEKRAAQKALYANRRRVRGRRGRLQRRRGEVVERTFAHLYETGGMRRVWVRGHENVRKRVLIPGGRLQYRAAPAPPDRHRYAPEPAGGRALSAIFRLIGRLIDLWGRLTRAWGFKWTPTALLSSAATGLRYRRNHTAAHRPRRRSNGNRCDDRTASVADGPARRPDRPRTCQMMIFRSGVAEKVS